MLNFKYIIGQIYSAIVKENKLFEMFRVFDFCKKMTLCRKSKENFFQKK